MGIDRLDIVGGGSLLLFLLLYIGNWTVLYFTCFGLCTRKRLFNVIVDFMIDKD